MPKPRRAPRSAASVPEPARTTAASRRDGDRGTGLLGTLSGFIVFLAFLLFAVQLLVNLYAASVVTSATYDAARTVASADDPTDPGVQAEAEAQARQQLGGYAERVEFTWTVDTDVVRLHVHAVNPRFLLPMLGGAVGFDTIDRTVQVRVERSR